VFATIINHKYINGHTSTRCMMNNISDNSNISDLILFTWKRIQIQWICRSCTIEIIDHKKMKIILNHMERRSYMPSKALLNALDQHKMRFGPYESSNPKTS
jgi:hypothetical protein